MQGPPAHLRAARVQGQHARLVYGRRFSAEPGARLPGKDTGAPSRPSCGAPASAPLREVFTYISDIQLDANLSHFGIVNWGEVGAIYGFTRRK